jgi:hypothetical protein
MTSRVYFSFPHFFDVAMAAHRLGGLVARQEPCPSEPIGRPKADPSGSRIRHPGVAIGRCGAIAGKPVFTKMHHRPPPPAPNVTPSQLPLDALVASPSPPTGSKRTIDSVMTTNGGSTLLLPRMVDGCKSTESGAGEVPIEGGAAHVRDCRVLGWRRQVQPKKVYVQAAP